MFVFFPIAFFYYFIFVYFYSFLKETVKFGSTVISIDESNVGYFFFYMISLVSIGLILIIFTIGTFIARVKVYNTFKNLGKEEYEIKITYEDLKLGIIQDIGMLGFSIATPPLLLNTVFWGIGLLYLFQFNNIISGFTFTIIGPVVFCVIIPLYYKSIIQLHKEIKNYKEKQSERIVNNIKQLNKNPPQYKDLYYIHNYSENTVEKINNWPIKTKSIYATGIAIGSLILQFISLYSGILKIFS